MKPNAHHMIRKPSRSHLVLILSLLGAQLSAQPLDTLATRYASLSLDSLIQRERSATDPREQCLLASMVANEYLLLPFSQEQMKSAMHTYDLAERLGNDTLRARAARDLGYAFLRGSDPGAALDHWNKAYELAERIQHPKLLSQVSSDRGWAHRLLGDYQGALRFLRQALVHDAGETTNARARSIMSTCYLRLGMPDSALYFAQEAAVEKDPRKRPYEYAYQQDDLATAYAANGQPDLAETYFKRTLATIDSFGVYTPLAGGAAGYADLLLSQGRKDEALTCALNGFRQQKRLGGGWNDMMVTSAGALARAYQANGLPDSALVYMTIRDAYRDTILDMKNHAQIQSRLFAQELKDIEAAKLRVEEAAARSRNIQFGIIALIVITLGIFLLVFSRTAIVGARTIKNLSLIALLLFFEFINLLVHPFLGELTHHSPLLLLLCMAAIAGLLIPLHHRMEKLITNMLVSKNNRVRLEAARRTIEELEGSGGGTNAS